MIPWFVFRSCLVALGIACGVVAIGETTASAAQLPFSPPTQPIWGRIIPQTNSTGLIQLEVRTWPTDGKLSLPAPFPNITAAYLIAESQRLPVRWVLNADASQVYLEMDAQPPKTVPALVMLETTENSRQIADGRIVFSALDAKVQGQRAKLESNPGNHRVGFWSDASDSVSWDFKPTRWGMYDVEFTFSADGGEGTELKFDMAGQIFVVTRPSTGSWCRYQTMPIGRLYLAKSEPFTVRASCQTLKGAAAMNLKAMTLRPAPEGKPITQEVSGAVTLHARDAITHSVMMRYEPATNKNCLGYWVNPNDWAEWQFKVTNPGTFEVEVWQGCGKGQGGSDVAVEILGGAGHASGFSGDLLDGTEIAPRPAANISNLKAASELRSTKSPNATVESPLRPSGDAVRARFDFVVEDTGHFQNFLPRQIGRIQLAKTGTYFLAVKPQRKQAGAIMDIRQVRLLSVKSANDAPPKAKSFLDARRVVFLGDSITYGGEYIEFLETYLRTKFPGATIDFINLGLPSETVSGLSEPGHAGGAFPRPDLHERLGRVLEKAKPDLIVACYGMNDGIYYPFGEERFEKFQDGMRRLRERAEAAGAKVIHVTPPTFDPGPLKGRTLPAGLPEYRSPYEGYNEVLGRYSEWLLAQRDQGWEVIDAHGPMNRFLAERRRENPNFLLAGDGVHANTQGHWLIAREILRYLGAPNEMVSADGPEALVKSHPRCAEVLKLVQQRQRVLKDAWLTHVGHLRPGMSKGKPFAEAERDAAEIDTKLNFLSGSINSPR